MSSVERAASVYADFLLPHLSERTDLVDVGCGDGELTVDLAPSVHSVVGIDVDEDDLAGARSRASRMGVGNATFETGDVSRLGLADDAADAVLGHSVLEALEHPATALREMRRVLRPGGVVAVASVEYDGLILAGPHEDLLRRFYEIRQELWIRDGADPYLGRRLRGLLAASGFGDVEATTKAFSYGTPTLVAAFGRGRAEDAADEWYVSSAVEAGLATPSELEAIHDAWLEWAESPSAYAAFTWCRALGWKVAGS
jgi:ubiquinone/menaquinone biosynthesis C-methylase UbiE